MYHILKSDLVLIFDGKKENFIEECSLFCRYNIQYYILEEIIHGRPSLAVRNLLGSCFIDCFDIIERLFLMAEMSMVMLNRSRVEQKS